jgi:hypothetical protein
MIRTLSEAGAAYVVESVRTLPHRRRQHVRTTDSLMSVRESMHGPDNGTHLLDVSDPRARSVESHPSPAMRHRAAQENYGGNGNVASYTLVASGSKRGTTIYMDGPRDLRDRLPATHICGVLPDYSTGTHDRTGPLRELWIGVLDRSETLSRRVGSVLCDCPERHPIPVYDVSATVNYTTLSHVVLGRPSDRTVRRAREHNGTSAPVGPPSSCSRCDACDRCVSRHLRAAQRAVKAGNTARAAASKRRVDIVRGRIAAEMDRMAREQARAERREREGKEADSTLTIELPNGRMGADH